MRTVLITGGLGFIGSNFVNYWSKKYPNDQIVIVDKGTYAASVNNILPEVQPDIFIRDINDSLSDIFSAYKPSIIVHFAAESHVDNSIDNPFPFIDSNVRGTASILQHYKEFCPAARMVHISTDEVYGAWDQTFTGFRESKVFCPSSPYAASKASAELILESFIRTYKLPYVVRLRCTNNYGPRQYKEKLLPKVITNALNNEPIPVYGDGKQTRDWLYVEDFCRAIEIVANLNREDWGEAYNISAHNNLDGLIPNISIINKVLDLLGKPKSLIKSVVDRPAHDRIYCIDSSKFRDEYGWKPKVDLDAGLQKTIEWYTK